MALYLGALRVRRFPFEQEETAHVARWRSPGRNFAPERRRRL